MDLRVVLGLALQVLLGFDGSRACGRGSNGELPDELVVGGLHGWWCYNVYNLMRRVDIMWGRLLIL